MSHLQTLILRLPRARGGRAAAAALAGAVLVAPLAAYAGHQFSDVPDTHPFHDEISAVADAGITTGFADGTFRPGTNVTRQAMAAFMERSDGRVAIGGGTVSVPAQRSVQVGAVTMQVGATQSGNGHVLVEGSGYAYRSPSGCPCALELRLIGPNGGVLAYGYTSVPGTAGSSGYALAPFTLQDVTPLAADVTRTFRLLAYTLDSGAPPVTVTGRVSAAYFPFSGDGDQTNAFTHTCPEDDGYEPNDGQGAAAAYYPGGSNSSVAGIACPGNDDWYQLAAFVSSGTTLTATAGFMNADGNIDVCIVHPGGSPSTCATTTNNTETVSVVAPTSGIYAVRVYLAADAGGYAGNRYQLTATSSAMPVAPEEPAPGPSAASPEGGLPGDGGQ